MCLSKLYPETRVNTLKSSPCRGQWKGTEKSPNEAPKVWKYWSHFQCETDHLNARLEPGAVPGMTREHHHFKARGHPVKMN